MQRSPIEWTHFTANPLRYRDPDGNIVHACIHKSGGCLHCYAEALADRYGRAGRKFTAENMKRLTPFLDDKELHHMLTYKPAAGQRCFVGDMTDIFGEWMPSELLSQLFAIFALRPDVTWQLLTKRPGLMLNLLSDEDFASEVDAFAWETVEGLVDPLNRRSDDIRATAQSLADGPLPNVWLGVSCEDQKTADERIPPLLDSPAAIRFVSYEPALGPIDFTNLQHLGFDALYGVDNRRKKIDWVIVGGESGPSARPFNIQWARDVIAQCKAADVACFVKQLGAYPHDGFPFGFPPIAIELNDRKGGDIEEWPEDLRVRDFPR